MGEFSPRGARDHVASSGRGAAQEAAPAGIFADDGALTRPVPIVAPRRVGDSELSVYPFALGAGRLAEVDEVAAGRILHRFAVRAGGLIDVVDVDRSGRSEEVVGLWLKRERPAAAVLALSPSLTRDASGLAGGARLRRAVEASLTRLGVEHVDLLVLDLGSAELSMEQQLGAAEQLVAEGKVRYLAASAATADQLLQARLLAAEGLPRLVAVRNAWDATSAPRSADEVRMVAAAQGLALLPDASAASLALAAPSLPQKVLAGWGRNAKLSLAVNTRVVAPAPERATDVLVGRGRPHRIAVALDRVSAELEVAPVTTHAAWLLAKRGVVAPIVSVTRADQLEPLMDAAAVRLTRSQMLELDRAIDER
ncbi:aldo/keto reductase [Gryllotalpicola ginsengisoli]|uniref:aldo/keto reductase n=1 Tax=Gryllotalpicola ginsengisoli TaxID=444608 RepID=UPI0003B6CB05|nr:aldo/keto reductase [Gryllotalpicola ginsengisoli]